MTTPICANLDVFADGELDPAAADAFRAHLPGCATCQSGIGHRLYIDTLAARAAEKAAESAPPRPPVGGPGLAQAARVVLDRGHRDTCGSALGPYPCSCGYDGLASALATEEAREKLRREAARLFWRDDIQDNRLTYSPDEGEPREHLEIDEDTVAAIRALFAAELGSAP